MPFERPSRLHSWATATKKSYSRHPSSYQRAWSPKVTGSAASLHKPAVQAMHKQIINWCDGSSALSEFADHVEYFQALINSHQPSDPVELRLVLTDGKDYAPSHFTTGEPNGTVARSGVSEIASQLFDPETRDHRIGIYTPHRAKADEGERANRIFASQATIRSPESIPTEDLRRLVHLSHSNPFTLGRLTGDEAKELNAINAKSGESIRYGMLNDGDFEQIRSGDLRVYEVIRGAKGWESVFDPTPAE
jgi:hypothetical protein